MFLLTSAALAVLTLTLLTSLRYFRHKPNHQLPDGPRGVPILGNLLQLENNGHKTLSQWVTKYGPVYTLNLFGSKALVVSNLDTMKEAFGSMESTGKLNDHVFGVVFLRHYGIVNTEGIQAMEQRKFFLRAVKATGATTAGSHYEETVLKEADNVCDKILRRLEKTETLFDLPKLFHSAIFKTMWSIAGGKTLINEGPNVYSAFLEVSKYIDLASRWGLSVLPAMKLASYLIPAYRKLDKVSREYYQRIRHNFKLLKISNSIKDESVFNAYKQKVETCTNPGSSFYGKIGWENSYSSVMAFFVGSTDTTATIINWIVFCLISNPEVQEKLHAEIDTVIGKESPAFAHKQSMVYLQAVILETLRYSSMFPFGLFHVLLDNVEFKGYSLPKGMLLIANMYHVHNDKAIWGDPEKFRPERFLSESKVSSVRILNYELKQFVVAFQVGKRACPGEVMARDVLFLFTAKIFQRFMFKPEASRKPQEYMEPRQGFILKTADIGVVMVPRS